jgi:hypothetical protein
VNCALQRISIIRNQLSNSWLITQRCNNCRQSGRRAESRIAPLTQLLMWASWNEIRRVGLSPCDRISQRIEMNHRNAAPAWFYAWRFFFREKLRRNGEVLRGWSTTTKLRKELHTQNVIAPARQVNAYSLGVAGCAAGSEFAVAEGEGKIRRNGLTLKKRCRHGSQRYAGKPSQRLNVIIEPASTRSREMCSRLKLPQRGQCAFSENAVATFHA